VVNDIIIKRFLKMQAYTNMVKTLYTTSKDYLWSMTEKAKEPMIKIDKTATIH